MGQNWKERICRICDHQPDNCGVLCCLSYEYFSILSWSVAYSVIVSIELLFLLIAIPLVQCMCGIWLMMMVQYVSPVLNRVINLILPYPPTVPFTSLAGVLLEIAMVKESTNYITWATSYREHMSAA